MRGGEVSAIRRAPFALVEEGGRVLACAFDQARLAR
jgi:hypothetical protein